MTRAAQLTDSERAVLLAIADAERSRQDVASVADLHPDTVGRALRQLHRLGLCRSSLAPLEGRRGPRRRLYRLPSMGSRKASRLTTGAHAPQPGASRCTS